jgi:outer membrane protein assembly factor BamD
LAFQDVPAAGSTSGTASPVVTDVQPSAPASSAGNSMGIEIVQPGEAAPAATSTTPPAFPGNAAAPAADPSGGLKPVGPVDATALPPVEKAAQAPDAINDVTPGSQPPAQTPPANGKKAKPALDKSDESSSKHKPKKGLHKLNPF